VGNLRTVKKTNRCTSIYECNFIALCPQVCFANKVAIFSLVRKGIQIYLQCVRITTQSFVYRTVICICCTLYVFVVLCVYCCSYFRCQTAGWKSVSGRSCDWPPQHRFFLVSLCLQANAEMVPKFPSHYYMLLM